MELDPKIKMKKIFDCFSDFEEVKKFYGKEVYCADFTENFSNLKLYTNKRKLKTFYTQECKPFLCGGQMYRYVLPCEFVEQEKQYRPYTLNEFLDKFHFGDSIILRPKINIKMEFHLVYNGYKIIDNNKIEFYFGPAIFTLLELFQSYERFYIGRWYPFGVEVEE